MVEEKIGALHPSRQTRPCRPPTPVPPPVHPPTPVSLPTPAEPTPAPAFQYPFIANPVSFNTGTPQMTRITGTVWKIIDLNTSQFDAEPGYQMRLIVPNGQEHLSDVSGLGTTDSTCPDCGDNRRMNMKTEFAPHLPGRYCIDLISIWHGSQQAAEVEFTLSSEPQQYVHVDFFPSE